MLQVGDILRMTNLSLANRSDKWGVCVCVAENLVLFINSKDRAMYECVPLKKANGRKFPFYDSYVGCHQAYEIFDHHISSVDGRITKPEAQIILDKVSKSKRMSKTVKSRIVESLKAHFKI